MSFEFNERKIKAEAFSGNDDISAEGIYKALEEGVGAYDIIIKKEVDSTNSELRRIADSIAAMRAVLIAESQTAGRGRCGRSFYSPKGCGIYMSLLLRDGFNDKNISMITTAVSVAVCKAVEKTTGRRLSIKWVNDLFLNGKKVCGILTEAVRNYESGEVEYIIIGIGINCKKFDPPEELSEIVASLETDVPRNRIVAAVLSELSGLSRLADERRYLDEYRERSMVIGKKIKILGKGCEYAKAVDIDERGALLVKTESGEVRALLSGEISIRLDK